jgi:hypothetical protein
LGMRGGNRHQRPSPQPSTAPLDTSGYELTRRRQICSTGTVAKGTK